jgi:long-chain acyl-CoA synthetase
LITTLMVGGTARLVRKSDPVALAKAIAEESVTIINGPAAIYQRLLEYKDLAGIGRLERGSLRQITVAGAPLDLDLKIRVEREFDLPLSCSNSITECSPGISGVLFDESRSDHAAGTLLRGVEARIRTIDGIPLGRDEVGELHVRGRNVMRGYYRAPDLTAEAMDSEGWFNTGNFARFDGDRLHIIGRTKEVIICSGLKVYPAEVEAVLNSHKDVLQSAIVGRAIPGDEEIVAFVQMVRGAAAKPADLMDYARRKLTFYKRPSEIIVVDALPVTSAGKMLKEMLKESLLDVTHESIGWPSQAQSRTITLN